MKNDLVALRTMAKASAEKLDKLAALLNLAQEKKSGFHEARTPLLSALIDDPKVLEQLNSLARQEQLADREIDAYRAAYTGHKENHDELMRELSAEEAAAASIANAARLSAIRDNAVSLARNAYEAYLKVTQATAELRECLTELNDAGGSWSHEAFLIVETLQRKMNPALLEESGWQRPKVTYGLYWKWDIRPLLPPVR